MLICRLKTSKPPSQNKEGVKGAIPGKRAEPEDDESEAINLKHDLDLQRLLKESHLLEQAKASSLPGTHRHKAVDMRMQTLGSKDSLFTQEKMPWSHRRGLQPKPSLGKACEGERPRKVASSSKRPQERTNPTEFAGNVVSTSLQWAGSAGEP